MPWRSILSGMTTTNFELARIAWRARDHMYQATQDIQRARDVLRGAAEHMQWRSRAAEQFTRRCEEVTASTGALVSRCDVASSTLLTIGNYLALQ